MSALARYRQNGFSLLELVIAMVLTALLAVMAMQPVLRALQTRAQVAGNLAAIDTLRFVTERIVRELRQVRYDAQGNGFQLIALDPIAGADNASSGLCFSRVGGSVGTTYANLAIRRNGTNASLDNVSWPGCVALSPKLLADNVSALRFDYWTYGSGTPIGLALDDSAFGTKLAFIDVTLSVTANGGPAVSYRSRVVLRNGAWGTAK
jgi:prepilin-type N-terminal cleavage/methylation domain-containing protein